MLPIIVSDNVFLLISSSVFGIVFLATAAIRSKIGLLSKRLLVASADEALARDRRDPVLLLRSFGDDHIIIPDYIPSAPGSTLGLRLDAGDERRSSLEALLEALFPASSYGIDVAKERHRPGYFEELLVALITEEGPVIAIGRPGERLPPPGAARFWVSDSEWHARVDELIRRSRRVVMVVGDIKGEDGLAWEARRLLNLEAAEKVLFIFPPLPNEVASRRWEVYRMLSEGRLPAFRGDELLVKLTRTGNSLVVRAAARSARNYFCAMERIRELEARHGDTPGPDRCFEVVLNIEGQASPVMDELLQAFADEDQKTANQVPQILRDIRL
jgi:hypothetical protein